MDGNVGNWGVGTIATNTAFIQVAGMETGKNDN